MEDSVNGLSEGKLCGASIAEHQPHLGPQGFSETSALLADLSHERGAFSILHHLQWIMFRINIEQSLYRSIL